MKTLLLTKEDVRQLISIDDVIEAVDEAYRAFNGGLVEQPDYIGLHLPAPRGEIDFKTCYYRTNELISMKASSGGFSENPSRPGLPGGMGTIILFDAQSGALCCVMDGSLITGLRTGASGAVSVRALARKNAKKIAAIGTGNQARMQIQAIARVMDIEEIHAWSRTPATRQAFKADIENTTGIPVIIADSCQAAVGQADILITTTRGKGPLIEADWILPGTHIIAIGTDQRGKQEFDPQIFGRAKVIVDSLPQCTQKGETWHALDRNIISENAIHAEIGEILSGMKPGRENDREITFFDSTGLAIQDNTTAGRIYRKALEKGYGTGFAFFE
ncbi:ornithine cyclodeaminase/alanine dehydrogenase [Pantoea sp. PNA 14-12]|uniref:ornithine cyclodeaminase family protein n=1 Tax=Pantoea TaxID=53335 RepID=UPI00105C97B1|nr:MULTISPECIES: ornithine cyclodeaminase family protein [Pantoea]NRH25386.1 ornithine cyclodeaminase [Pantoea stewartii]TDS71297.1 ornithine cyclodeaminase/alanine dehydrogenase [Pantoea sp. PNA 14-12]WRH22061.1 ornithine cyclodeaminase family protein [Pantoea sp. JZ29]